MTTLTPEREAEIRAALFRGEPEEDRPLAAVADLLAALDATRAELAEVLRDEHSASECCNRMARDLALLAEVRGHEELITRLMASLAANAEREAESAERAHLTKLAHSSRQEATAWSLLVRLLRGEG